MTATTTTRRAVLAGGAAIAAAPLAASLPAFAASTASGEAATPVALLWAQAESLKARLAAHAEEIAANAARTGLPGWMHARGAANALGNQRYEAIVAILNGRARSVGDLAILAKATGDADMRQGPASWAHARFDEAARVYHMAA